MKQWLVILSISLTWHSTILHLLHNLSAPPFVPPHYTRSPAVPPHSPSHPLPLPLPACFAPSISLLNRLSFYSVCAFLADVHTLGVHQSLYHAFYPCKWRMSLGLVFFVLSRLGILVSTRGKSWLPQHLLRFDYFRTTKNSLPCFNEEPQETSWLLEYCYHGHTKQPHFLPVTA